MAAFQVSTIGRFWVSTEAYAVRSAMSWDETGLNPRQRHRSNENTVAEIITTDGVLG